MKGATKETRPPLRLLLAAFTVLLRYAGATWSSMSLALPVMLAAVPLWSVSAAGFGLVRLSG